MIQEQTVRSGRPRMAEISNNKNNTTTSKATNSSSNTLQLFHSLDDNNNIPLTVTMITNNNNNNNNKNIINNNNNDSITNNNNNNSSNNKITISLPENILDSLHKSEHFPTNRNRWNTNEEIAALLISIDQHEKWLSEEVQLRPKSGSMLLYSRKHVHYRRDGYCWKKRKDGKTTREDHMKLKVQGIECIYGCYVHSAILPTFHRRCYWLLQNPNIVLVHYLNVPTNDDNKTISRSLNSLPDTRKEWTREDLIQELKPMFYSIINETDNEYGNNNDNNDELEQSTLDMIESIIQQLLFKQRERCIKSPEDLTTTTTIMPTNNHNNGTNNNNNNNITNEFISIRSITNNCNNTSISTSNLKNSNIRAHQIFTSLSSGQIVEAANSNNNKLFNVSENNSKRNSNNNNNDIVDINGNSLILQQQQPTNNTVQVLQLTNAARATGTRLCQLNTSGDHLSNHHGIIEPPNSLGNGCRLTTATGQQQQTSPIITLNMSQIQSSFIILNNNNDHNNNNNNNDSNSGNTVHTSNSNNNHSQNAFNKNKNNQNGNESNTNTMTITDQNTVSSILSFVTYQKQQQQQQLNQQQNQRTHKQRHHRTGSIQEDHLDQLQHQYQQQSNCLLTAKSSSTSLSPLSQCSSSSSSSSSSIAFKVPINIGINTESLSSSSSLSSISPTSSSTTTTLFATTLVTETQTKNSVMTPILTTTVSTAGSVIVPNNNNNNNNNNCSNQVSSNKSNDDDDDVVDDEMAQVLTVNEIEMDTLNNLDSRNFNLDDEESMLICSNASTPERSIINNHNLNFVNSLTSNNNNNNNPHDHYLNHHLKSENDDTNFDAFDTMYDDRGAGLIHSSSYVSNRHHSNNPFISNNMVNQHSLHSSLINGRNQINANPSSSHNNNNNNNNINIKNECLMNVSTNSVETFDTHQAMDFMDHEDISTSDDILFNLETFDMFGEFDHLDQESTNTENVLSDDGNLNANQVNDNIKTEIIDDIDSCQQTTNNNENDNKAIRTINLDNKEQESRLDNKNNNDDKNNKTTIPIIRPSSNEYDRQSCIMENTRHQLSTAFIKNEIDSENDDDVDDDNIPTSVQEYWAKQSEIATTTTDNKKTEPGGQVNFSTIISGKTTNETSVEDPKTTNITTMIIGSSGNDNCRSIVGTSTTSIDVTVDENGNLSITKTNRRTSGGALQQKQYQTQKNISTMSQNHPLLKRQLSTVNLLMVDNNNNNNSNSNDNNNTNNGLTGSTHQQYHNQQPHNNNFDHTEESRRVYYSSVSNNTASSSSSPSSTVSVDSTVATSTFDVNHNGENINRNQKNSLKDSTDAETTIISNTNNNIINITDYSPEWCYTEGGIKVLVAGPWYESNDGGGGNQKNRYSILFDNIPVPTELVQNGLLRCFSPKHEIGFVTLNVSCNDVIISNSVIFEYRMSNTTNNSTGNANNNNSSTGTTFHNSSPIPPPSSSSTSSSPSSFYLTINENSLSINNNNNNNGL